MVKDGDYVAIFNSIHRVMQAEKHQNLAIWGVVPRPPGLFMNHPGGIGYSGSSSPSNSSTESFPLRFLLVRVGISLPGHAIPPGAASGANYAVDPTEAQYLSESLNDFSSQLPAKVIQRGQ